MKRMADNPRGYATTIPQFTISSQPTTSSNASCSTNIFAKIAARHKRTTVPVVSIEEEVTKTLSPPEPKKKPSELKEEVDSIGIATEVVDLSEGEIVSCSDDSDDIDDIVVLEDLTVIDETEITVVEEKSSPLPRSVQRKMRATRMVPDERALEDSLCKVTVQNFQKPTRFWHSMQKIPLEEKSEELRICSYNVLCQITIGKTMYLYRHTNSSDQEGVLAWETRWPKLRENLEHIDADVLGLQEVQHDHYDDYFRPFMESKGYGGFYKRKTGNLPDGCALFYRKDKYEALKYTIVEYNMGPNTKMDRDQIGQVLRLRSRKTREQFIVANTHLIYNDKAGDIKIGQLATLFAHIYQDMESRGNCPLILLGDFNIEPYSYVYTYIVTNKIFLKGLPRNELSGQGQKGGDIVKAHEILPPNGQIARDGKFWNEKRRSADRRKSLIEDHTFTHPFTLASVYRHTNVNNEKDVSTYHKEAANPDFIFYSVKRKNFDKGNTHIYELPSLRLKRMMTLPDLATLKTTTGPWPTIGVPSDHIPLVADFLLFSSK